MGTYITKGRMKDGIILPQPNPRGLVKYDSATTRYSAGMIPIVGSTDFLYFTSSVLTRFTVSGSIVWSFAYSTYAGSGAAPDAVTIQSGVVYLALHNVTGTYIGWLEVDISTGSVTDNFSTQTYTIQPSAANSSNLILTATELKVYAGGVEYVFNRSTKAKTSEARISSQYISPLEDGDEFGFGVRSDTTYGTSIWTGYVDGTSTNNVIVFKSGASKELERIISSNSSIYTVFCTYDDVVYLLSFTSSAHIYSGKHFYLSEFKEFCNNIRRKYIVEG